MVVMLSMVVRGAVTVIKARLVQAVVERAMGGCQYHPHLFVAVVIHANAHRIDISDSALNLFQYRPRVGGGKKMRAVHLNRPERNAQR
jgi:hypothetical protein